MALTKISVRGARQHNLKNIDVEIPRNSLTVVTGLSGSGKSSLAFDTIYAEGQRRYVETLSAYARQFLDQMERPDVDSIDGLSPSISIEQKTTSRSPRSTVGTITEIYDYLRLLFASIGVPHCPRCGRATMAERRLPRMRSPSVPRHCAPCTVSSDRQSKLRSTRHRRSARPHRTPCASSAWLSSPPSAEAASRPPTWAPEPSSPRRCCRYLLVRTPLPSASRAQPVTTSSSCVTVPAPT